LSTKQEIDSIPENQMSQNDITKIVEHMTSMKTRDYGMGKNTQLVLQEVYKFNTERCIWDGKTLEPHFRGRGNKAFCDRVCHKRAWEFNNRLEKVRLLKPIFYSFIVQMLKEGIPADKLDLYLRVHRKAGYTKTFSREDFEQ